MYFLFLGVVLYISFVFYNRYLKMPDAVAFGEEDSEEEPDINKVELYKVFSNDELIIETNSKTEVVNRLYNINKQSDSFLRNDMLYVIKYTIDTDEYTCVSGGFEVVSSLPYKNHNLKKFLFARMPIKAEFLFKNEVIDITEYLDELLGPNLNFHNDITNTKVKDIFKYLFLIDGQETDRDTSEIRNCGYSLRIKDNLGAMHTFGGNETLVWKPEVTSSTR